MFHFLGRQKKTQLDGFQGDQTRRERQNNCLSQTHPGWNRRTVADTENMYIRPDTCLKRTINYQADVGKRRKTNIRLHRLTDDPLSKKEKQFRCTEHNFSALINGIGGVSLVYLSFFNVH